MPAQSGRELGIELAFDTQRPENLKLGGCQRTGVSVERHAAQIHFAAHHAKKNQPVVHAVEDRPPWKVFYQPGAYARMFQVQPQPSDFGIALKKLNRRPHRIKPTVGYICADVLEQPELLPLHVPPELRSDGQFHAAFFRAAYCARADRRVASNFSRVNGSSGPLAIASAMSASTLTVLNCS